MPDRVDITLTSGSNGGNSVHLGTFKRDGEKLVKVEDLT